MNNDYARPLDPPSQDGLKHLTAVGSSGSSCAASIPYSSHTGVEDDTYYYEVVVILIDGVFFSIPQTVLRDSEVFQDMFSMPHDSSDKVILDGRDKEHPLRLDGYSASDFRILLRVIHPIPAISHELKTWQEWASVLMLSTAWAFADARARAIHHLSLPNLQPPTIDRIILSKRYNVQDWLVPALQDLAEREEPLSVDEGRRLSDIMGWEFILRLCRVREMGVYQPLKHSDLGWRCDHCTSFGAFGGATGSDNPHEIRCVHGRRITISPRSSDVINTWPCAVCTTYFCASNNMKSMTGSVFNKPESTARTHRNFIPAIREELGIDV